MKKKHVFGILVIGLFIIVLISGIYLYSKKSIDNKNSEIIDFDKTSYSCEEGQILKAVITATGPSFPSVSSYESSNIEVAMIVKDPTMSIKCYNCIATEIICLKTGKATLTALSSTGASKTVEVIVD